MSSLRPLSLSHICALLVAIYIIHLEELIHKSEKERLAKLAPQVSSTSAHVENACTTLKVKGTHPSRSQGYCSIHRVLLTTTMTTIPHPFLKDHILYVTNVPNGTKWAQVSNILSSCGPVMSGGRKAMPGTNSKSLRWKVSFPDIFKGRSY